jgi:hypothetical protein
MVERPIKKSERQAKANLEANSEHASTVSEEHTVVSEEHTVRPVRKDKDRSSDQGEERGRSKGKRGKDKSRWDTDGKPPVNPALMRGPKPVKAKSEPEPEPELPVESTAIESEMPVESITSELETPVESVAPESETLDTAKITATVES